MLLRFMRQLGVLLLLATLAVPATMADAATHSKTRKGSRTSIGAKAKPAKGKSARAKSRGKKRGRRGAPPAGGVYARHAILIDPATGEILFSKSSDSSVPIASLTKLMTAMVFLEQRPHLDRMVEVTPVEITGGGHTQLRKGEQVALGDLLHMSLMCSDNVATRVIARESGLSGDEFVARMNRKAIELGLTGSRFVEFTGLDERNVSSASDIARLLHAAAHEPLIQEITTTKSYEFSTERRAHAIHNTNRLLYGRYDVLGGKTGFISEAGYCFATWIRSQGRDLIAVVLGAPTGATRFADAVRLIQKSTTTAVASTGP
ncbi:MAG: D-alanyl-D-alanine carboxypeptidase [Candidatus Eisenbacteria bacterium]|nr:D-alanyl-D-alanine carboxypeptidase [Candidatus Eisenbacteria bacterium]